MGLFFRSDGFHELRRLIGAALALVEDQPAALRQVDTELHVALDDDVRAVLIFILFRFDNVVSTVTDQPAFKVVHGVGRRKGLVHGVVCIDRARVRADRNLVRAERDPVLIKIGHIVGAEQHRMVRDRHVRVGKRVRSRRNVRANAADVHAPVDIAFTVVGDIIGIRRPAAEHDALRDRADARIIDDLVELLSADVRLLDIHGGDFGRAVHELDRQTRDHDLNHDVYGEVLCREADSIIVGGYGLHKLAAAAALVIDLQRLSIAERIIRDGDRDRLLRLPALSAPIENGDIIGSEHLLIGRGGAGGALGGSSTIDALENHLRLGCALLDRCHAAAYRQEAVNTDIAGGHSLLFGLDGLLGGGLFSRGCRDLDKSDTGGRIAHRNRREIVFAGDDLQLAALHTAVQRDESKRLALFKRRHRLDADSQLEILAVAADRPAFKNGTSLDGSDGNALQLGRVLIGGIAALCHSDGIFALALVAVRYVDGLFDLDDGLFRGLGILRELGRFGILRELGRFGILRELGRLGILRELGRLGILRKLGRIGLIRLFSRLRILRKLDHIIILVSAVVQAGGQGLIAGPQYHQQGKQKREYALRQFVHLMRASYSYTWRRIAPPRFIYCVMGFAGAVSLGFAVYIEVAMLFPTGLGLRFAGGVFRSFAYFSLFSSACALE